MTQWTFITSRQRAIVSARTIKTIQTKQRKESFSSKWHECTCVCMCICERKKLLKHVHIKRKYFLYAYSSFIIYHIRLRRSACVLRRWMTACGWQKSLPLGTGAAAGLAVFRADGSQGALLRSHRALGTVITWLCKNKSHERDTQSGSHTLKHTHSHAQSTVNGVQFPVTAEQLLMFSLNNLKDWFVYLFAKLALRLCTL